MNEPISRRIAGAGLLALDVVISERDSRLAASYAGGTCGNVLSILSYFGWRAFAVASIGNDVAGERLLADLMYWQVGLDRVVIDPKARTPVFIQRLERDGVGRPQHSFVTECPSCGEPLTADRVFESPISEFSATSAPEFFFMDRLSSSIVSLAQSAARQGGIVVYEPSAESDLPFWKSALAITDILKYSEDRFRPADFEAHRPARRACWEIQTHGAWGLRFRRYAGSFVDSRWSNLTAIAAPRLVDTCGAGDWCTAGLLFTLGRQDAPLEALRDRRTFVSALRTGQAYSAWACGFEGARGAMYANGAPETNRIVAALLEDGFVSSDHSVQFSPDSSNTHESLNLCDAARCARQGRSSNS